MTTDSFSSAESLSFFCMARFCSVHAVMLRVIAAMLMITAAALSSTFISDCEFYYYEQYEYYYEENEKEFPSVNIPVIVIIIIDIG